MFCPKCEAEYREGFTECSDCQVALVDKLPEKEPPDFVEFEEILTTKDSGEVAFIKSLLEAEGIPFVVEGDHFSNIYGYIIPVRFLVDKDKVEFARELLKDFL